MKNYLKLMQSTLFVMLVFLLASCSTEKSKLTAIPNDAGFVMVVDGKALKEKGNIKSISESKMYKKVLSEISDEKMKDLQQFEYLFKDTKESGVSINDEFVFFMKMNAGEPVLGFNLLVLDKSKVDTLFAKVTEKEEDIQVITEDGLSYIAHEHAIIAWNNKQLLVLAQGDVAEDALLNQAKELLNQTSNQSIFSNSNFDKFYAKRKDVSIWFNYDLFLNNMPPAQQMMISSQLPFSMKGTYFYGYISFEKGQVVAEYESIMNDEMKAFIKNYQFINDDFDTNVLSMLPKSSFANFEISLSLFDYYHMFLDMYKEKQIDTEMYTSKVEDELGVSIDDLLKSFSGEMAISLHGLGLKEKTGTSYEVDENGQFRMVDKTLMQPEFLYSSVIKFKNDKLWDIVESRAADMGLQKQDGFYAIPQAGVNIAYVNHTMFITNDIELMQKVVADGSTNPNLKSSEVADHLNKYPAYMELNMDLDEYPEDVKNYIQEESKGNSDAIFRFLSTYKRLQVIPNDIYSAKIILQLKDDSKNSLDVILHDLDETSDLISKN